MASAEIYTIEDTSAGRLSIMPRPRGGDWLAEEIGAIRAAGVDVLVSLLTAGEAAELDLTQEEGLCLAHGIRYLSLPIADFGLPDSHRETVGLLARLKGLLEEGQHVALHCAQ